MSARKQSAKKSSRAKDHDNDVSSIDDTSPKCKNQTVADFLTPKAAPLKRLSMSKSPKEISPHLLNKKYELESYKKILFYSNFVPTYISGAKAFTSKSIFDNTIGILWVIYGGCVFYHVLAFLNMYYVNCLLYTSPSPRDRQKSRMPSSA